MNFSENSVFCKNDISLFVGLGMLWVRQALFLNNLENFENFKRLSIPWTFPYDLYFRRYTCLKSPQNRLYWLYSKKYASFDVFWVPCPKCTQRCQTRPTTPQKKFWKSNGFIRPLGEKIRLLWVSGRNSTSNVKMFDYFDDPKTTNWSKFWPKLAEKQHLLKNVFRQNFSCFLANILCNFDVCATNSDWAISVFGFWSEFCNFISDSSPWWAGLSWGKLCT